MKQSMNISCEKGLEEHDLVSLTIHRLSRDMIAVNITGKNSREDDESFNSFSPIPTLVL